MANGNPSSWVNLQDYLGLNADQGQQMGQAVYDNVTGTASKANAQLGNDVTGFNAAAQQGTVQAPTTDYSQVDAGAAAANSSKSYSGPTDLASYDPTLEGNVAKSVQQMQMAADPNQRGQVLQETFGSKAGSTMGDNAFDSFLVSGSPAGEQLGQFGTKFKDLQNALGIGEQNAYDTAQKGMTDSQSNAKEWSDDASFQQGMKTLQAVKNANVAGYRAYADQLDAAASNKAAGLTGADMVKAIGSSKGDNSYLGWLKPNASQAEQQLGLSNDQLMKDVGKMTGQEAKDFMVLGVVPPWMTDVDASKRGRLGGWQTPQMGSVLKYGSDGGMWNAVTNTWKSGLTTLGSAAAGGPGGIVGAGVKTAANGGNGQGISY